MLNIYKMKRLELKLRQVDVEKLTGIKQIRISYIERGIPPKSEEKKLLDEALKIEKEK